MSFISRMSINVLQLPHNYLGFSGQWNDLKKKNMRVQDHIISPGATKYYLTDRLRCGRQSETNFNETK